MGSARLCQEGQAEPESSTETLLELGANEHTDCVPAIDLWGEFSNRIGFCSELPDPSRLRSVDGKLDCFPSTFESEIAQFLG